MTKTNLSILAVLVVGHDNCQAIQLAKDAVAGNENSKLVQLRPIDERRLTFVLSTRSDHKLD